MARQIPSNSQRVLKRLVGGACRLLTPFVTLICRECPSPVCVASASGASVHSRRSSARAWPAWRVRLAPAAAELHGFSGAQTSVRGCVPAVGGGARRHPCWSRADQRLTRLRGLSQQSKGHRACAPRPACCGLEVLKQCICTCTCCAGRRSTWRTGGMASDPALKQQRMAPRMQPSGSAPGCHNTGYACVWLLLALDVPALQRGKARHPVQQARWRHPRRPARHARRGDMPRSRADGVN